MSPSLVARSKPARVLIVDDERDNRELLEIILAREGFAMSTAASGAEALAAVARQLPDLILLDVMMPGMDGYQVAQQLKADPATAGVLIIMVTALNDRGARTRAARAGADDFLSKPLDRAGLYACVKNLLLRKATHD
jgi:CheY-like chemotaxis protein